MQLYQNEESRAPINLEYASFWKRMAAFFTDTLIISFFMSLFVLPVIGIDTIPELTDIEGRLKLQGLVFLVAWLYFASFESSSRQATLGKQVFGIFVTDTEGYRLSFLRASGRYFGKVVSNLTLLIGYLMAAFTRRRQALHDKIAGTLVLQHPGYTPAKPTEE
ncbi:putative RDD family membrane protein YckC [Pontibacter mucosus]|uniref:Putative RDD family membrane protein YckC n=1 Tax=Pontibacter mucosus TaxID=1649266 RepID=A0A2T5YFU4_9BACT|nr:RDD family protein [Pontibacter mucosus]PTX18193.1 putative RDD family membrane protein YckC [Pontibacter mucosus]